MKISLRMFVVAASLAVAAPLYAQGGGGGGGGGRGPMTPEQQMAQVTRNKDLMFKDITLTPAQSAKADTVFMDAMKKQADARAAMQPGGDMTAMRDANAKMTTDRNAALKAILKTDADKAKFDANVAAMPAGRGRGGL